MKKNALRLLSSKENLKKMKCWYCNTELNWGGDHDCEDDSEYLIETNLSCPQCNAFVMVYLPKDEK